MHDPLVLILVFIFAITFGSFLNVLIYRLPREISIVRPGSHCPQCKNPVKPYDNIPILSYLILRGQCRHCGARISPRYMLVELLAGLLVVFSIYHFGLNVRGFVAAYLSLVFIAVFFIDLEFTIIPDFFTLPGIIIGFAVSFIPGSLIGCNMFIKPNFIPLELCRPFNSILGIIVGWGVFHIITILGSAYYKTEAMGFGDVKFAAMLGGFLGILNLFLIFVLAAFIGSIIGVFQIYLSNRKKRSIWRTLKAVIMAAFFKRGEISATIPFGPYLVAAALIAIYLGKTIMDAYIKFVRG